MSILQSVPGGKLGLALGGLLGAAFLDAKFYISRDVRKIVGGVQSQKQFAEWDKSGAVTVVERFLESCAKFPSNKCIVAKDETGKWTSWTYDGVDKSACLLDSDHSFGSR